METAGALFLMGFVGDIGTQISANYTSSTSLFEDYWKKYGRLPAAVIAGLITLIFGGMMILLAIALFRWMNLNPRGWSFILFATAKAFLLGFFLDLMINRRNYIPSLRKWYDGMGSSRAALWSGGLAFAFTIFVVTLVLYR